jgi:hypothetical protein
MLNQLDKWHKSRGGYLFFALAELVIAYWFISLAIDKGSLLFYLLALIFFVGFLQNLIKFIATFIRKRRR